MRIQTGYSLILALCLSVVSCTSPPPSAPDPAHVLQAIPAADAAKYESVRDMKTWKNPYIIVRGDGVTLYDSADSAEILLKTDELLPALAKLPVSNWPYGRVLAAAEDAKRNSEQDGIAIRKNKGIVGGMLHEAGVQVRWVTAN